MTRQSSPASKRESSQSQLGKAWVITYSKLDAHFFSGKKCNAKNEYVIGIQSARNSGNFIGLYIEWAYMALMASPHDYLHGAHYTKPQTLIKPIPAENYYAGQFVYCGSKNLLQARLGSNISFQKIQGEDWLEWDDPIEITIEREGHNNKNVTEHKSIKKLMPFKTILEVNSAFLEQH